MKIISDKEFADFLTTKPLYSKFKAVEGLTHYDSSAFVADNALNGKSFKFLCPIEDDIQTFKTELADNSPYRMFPTTPQAHQKLPDTFNDKSRKLDLIVHLKGVCQSCEAKIDFLIKATSDKDWDQRNEGLTIFLQKVGQFPPYDISLNDNLKKYLSAEDQINYRKALVCLSISYGIGSFAYFRRIIENEIKRIIKDISELEFDDVQLVRDAYAAFEKDFQMSKLIDILNKHLPGSLKELGDNPIRLLYEQLSGGIHEFTEEKCIEKSQSIDVLLNYVIKKVNEEKYQLSSVRSAMQRLRKSNN